MMNRITCRFGSYCTSQNEKGKGIPTLFQWRSAMSILEAFGKVKNMKISILSNLFTKVVNNHYYYAPVINVPDDEQALRVVKELPDTHVVIKETDEEQETENQ
jgi:hypothetical protein